MTAAADLDPDARIRRGENYATDHPRKFAQDTAEKPAYIMAKAGEVVTHWQWTCARARERIFFGIQTCEPETRS
jgi:hypothetical protein